MRKRFMAVLLVLCLIVGILPVSVMADDFTGGTSAKANVEQTTVTVDYPTADRSKATITYHKGGIKADSFNLVFLVDASTQGKESYNAFERMMRDSGAGYIYDYDADSTVQIVTYQNTATSSGNLSTKQLFLSDFAHHGVIGQGTARETAGLASAISAVQNIKQQNSDPTVVFWILGERFGENDTEVIEEQIKALKNALGEDGALITWQYRDQPSELLMNYATQYTEAHDTSGQRYPAAYAAKDAILMQEGMAADLEEIVHDHYHNISFSLKLDDAQTLAERITNVRYEAESSIVSLTTELWDDGQGLDVHIERQCRQIDIDFIIELDLKTDVYEKQTVMPAGKIIADHDGGNGGLHTGMFDDEIAYGLELDLPSVELDRTAHNIIFQDAAGVENITDKIVGETITLPMGDGVTQEGASFGGWNVVAGANQGRHYNPGEIIFMPDGDMTLAPAFGHVEVELEIDYEQGEPITYGNQMRETSYYRPYLCLADAVLADGSKVGTDAVVSIQVIDFLPEYDIIPPEQQNGDSDKVMLTNVPDAVYARHIGDTEDDKVVVYLVPNKDQAGKYDMYIAGPGGVKAPVSCDSLFDIYYHDEQEDNDINWFRSVTTMDLKELDTSAVRAMDWMFYNCSSLTELDVSTFDTSQVTDMSLMFSGCSSLTELDVSAFDTSQVTDMSSMFGSCSSLTKLDVSTFDTSQVTDMGGMFGNCISLTELDVKEFDTSRVTDMASMFNNCSGLTSLDLSGFDTSQVENMSWMFRSCSGLTSLDLSGFDTSQVMNMSQMFYNCSGLTSLNLSGLDTANVTKMRYMFSNCSGLTSLDLSDFDTAKVTDMCYMFSNCSGLTSLNLSGFNTARVEYMIDMFQNCSDLSNLNLKGFDTSNVKSMYGMFMGCESLPALDLSDFNTSQVTSMYGMFSGCSELEALLLGNNFDISKVTSIKNMFNGCGNLMSIKGITLGETNEVNDFSSLFDGLSKLETVIFFTPLSGAAFPKLSTMNSMFKNCSSLTNLDLGSWYLENLTDTSDMFYNCSSLETLDISWSGIRAEDGGYTITNMFYNVPTSTTLNLVADTTPMLAAIRDAFPGIVNTSGTFSADLLTKEDIVADDGALDGDVVDGNVPDSGTDSSVPDGDAADGNVADSGTDSSVPGGDVADGNVADSGTDSSVPGGDVADGNVADSGTDSSVPDGDAADGNVPDSSIDSSVPGGDAADGNVPDSSTDSSVPGGDVVNGNPEDSNHEMETNTGNLAVLPTGAADLTLLSAPVSTYNSGNGNIYVHPTEVNGGDTITYKITVKYVGDVGVKSGRITLEFPIPEDVKRFVGTAGDPDFTDPGWYETTTDIQDSGAPTGYKGGRVVEEPKVVEDGKGGYVLKGVFEGLYTGTEVKVSIRTTLDNKSPDDYNAAGYAFWDGTAYASSSAGTVPSNMVRLWTTRSGGGTQPGTSYMLSYQFAGDVPDDAVLPTASAEEGNANVTAAAAPGTQQTGYSFDGWYRSDNDQKVSPGNSFTMPDSDLTLIGKWTLDDQYIERITVKYEYTDNNDGKHIPEGAPTLQVPLTVKVGQTHYIQKINQDADYHKFGGWEPTLSVGGTNVPLTEQSDGSYQSDDGQYTINTSGTLSTDQFAGKTDVVVTFSGAWTPYKGTIHFDANGGEGTMNDMTDVTWDTTDTLTRNTFTYGDTEYSFNGWAKSAAGNVVKADGATADGLIDADGKTVTLFAIWKRSSYGVGYNLTNVTSTNNVATVNLNGNYSTKLTAENGYKMDEVVITMGGKTITSQVYDEATGQVTINSVDGNIIIKASAIKNGGGTGGGGGGSYNKYPIHVDPVGDGTVSSDKDEAAFQEKVTITVDGTVDSIKVIDGNKNTVEIKDNGDGTYTFEMPKAEVTVTVVFETAEPDMELPETADPEETGVAELLDTNDHRAYLNGYENGEFRPDNNMTRAEVAQMFYNLLLDKEVPITVSFTDVSEDAWYSKAVNTLASMDILAGVGENQFAPNRPITRAEFTVIAMRFTKGSLEGENIFTDISENDWFYDRIIGSIQYGWIGGYSDGTFRPNKSITRAEVTTIVNKMLGRSADQEFIRENPTELKLFQDLSQSHWAYYQIMEAANAHKYTKNEQGETWTK